MYSREELDEEKGTEMGELCGGYLLSKEEIKPKWEALLKEQDLGFIYKWMGEKDEVDSNTMIGFVLKNPYCTKVPVNQSVKKLEVWEREIWQRIWRFKQDYLFEKTEVCTRWEQKLKLDDAVFARFLCTRTKNGKVTEWFCKMAMEHPNFVGWPLGKLLGDLDMESQQKWDSVKMWYNTYTEGQFGTEENDKNHESCRITTNTPRPKFSPFVVQGNGPAPSLESFKCAMMDGDEHYRSSGEETDREFRMPRNLEEAAMAHRRRGLKRKIAVSETSRECKGVSEA